MKDSPVDKTTNEFLKGSTTSYLNNARDKGWSNNNPCNLKYNKNNNWQGRIPLERSAEYKKFKDGKYKSMSDVHEQFETVEHGLRAGIILMRSYIPKGFNTLKKFFDRYAPTSDNVNLGENEYAAYIAKKMGWTTTQTFKLDDAATISKFLRAVVSFENKYQKTLTDSQVATALQMAGVSIA